MVGFENYQKSISPGILDNALPKEEPIKKYVVVLKLKYPKIKSFDEDKTRFESDINSIIEEHNKNTTLKVRSKLHLLEMKGLLVVIGLEIPESYEQKNIGRHIGNYLSKPLYNKLQWKELVDDNGKGALFVILETNEYKEDSAQDN